jgi:hypothetical protein
MLFSMPSILRLATSLTKSDLRYGQSCGWVSTWNCCS